LAYREIEKRQFGDWSMGYVLSNEKNRRLFLAYSPEARFSPLTLGAAAAEKLLDELAEHARMLGAAPATAV
jgi:hypothetical protein